MSILQKLDKINGFHYEWNDTMKELTGVQGKEYGVIAQEVQKQFPDLVSLEDDGYLAVDYIQFIPILLQAIKELNAKVETLNQKINKNS
jgi:hypothetical protein